MKKGILIGLLVLIVGFVATVAIVSAENPYDGGAKPIGGDDVGAIVYAADTCPEVTLTKWVKERSNKILHMIMYQGIDYDTAYESTWGSWCKCMADNFCDGYAKKNFEQCRPKEEA